MRVNGQCRRRPGRSTRRSARRAALGAAAAVTTLVLTAGVAHAGYKRVAWQEFPGSGADMAASISASTDAITSVTTGNLIPVGTFGAGAAAIGTRVYVAGGATGACTDAVAPSALKAVSVFDTSTGSWASARPLQLPRARRPLLGAVGGVLYAVGGTSGCRGTTTRATERLDPVTGGWSVLPASADLPAALDGGDHCGVAVGGRLVTFQSGGIGIFDPRTTTWKVLPADRRLATSAGCAAAVVQNRTTPPTVIVTGVGSLHSSVLSFNPGTGALTTLAVSTTPRTGHVALGLDLQVALAGGDGGQLGVEAVDASAPPSVMPVGGLPAARFGAVGVTIAGRFYVLAGRVGTSTRPPVWLGTPS